VVKMTRYKYLGKKVPDIKRKGLDTIKEFYGIMRAIVRDVKARRISRNVARGRLLLLYRLTFPKYNSKVKGISKTTLEKVRRDIKKLMSQI